MPEKRVRHINRRVTENSRYSMAYPPTDPRGTQAERDIGEGVQRGHSQRVLAREHDGLKAKRRKRRECSEHPSH